MHSMPTSRGLVPTVCDIPLWPADAATPEADGSDWIGLLSAISRRLRETVAALPVRARPGLRDCLAALDLLHEAAQQEIARNEQLTCELAQARQALDAALAELAGTRAGEARALQVAMHDGLTSLVNRQAFRARLDDALAHPAAPGLAVMYLDLDGFKGVNDLHGHEVGDQLLRIVAERLRRAVRHGDLWGRIGGDEFACLYPRVGHRRQLGAMARKLIAAVSAPVTLGVLQLRIRPSIGIAIAPIDATNTGALLDCADAAMYRAMRTQTGYAFHAPHLDGGATSAPGRSAGPLAAAPLRVQLTRAR